MTTSRRYVWMLLFLWIAGIALAMAIDRPVALWVQAHRPLDRKLPDGAKRSGNHPVWTTHIVRLPGNYVFVLLAGIAVGFWHRRRWTAALPVLLSGPLVGATYLVLKWIVGRRRPLYEIAPFTFHPFINGIDGLLHSVSGLAFPSGDATMAFAGAMCMAIALPRWSATFFFWGVLVAAERVLENAHYMSDVVAGAGLGILCAMAAVRISDRIFAGRARAIDPNAGFSVNQAAG